MTTDEAGKYLGVHEMTVYRMVRDKKLPAMKVGGQWRFHKPTLDKWIETESMEHMTK